MRILYLDETAVNLNNDIDFSKLQALGEFITFPRTTESESVIKRGGNDDVILVVNKVKITKEVVDSLPNLRHVAVTATGFNNVDTDACRDAGITVSNVPGYSTDSVAQHIFTMILNLATSIHRYDQDVKSGEWERSLDFTLLKYPTFELKGKALGIIGFGAIGQEVAKIGEVFGMKVMMNRKSKEPVGHYQYFDLEEIYKEADIVSLNCPLTEENKGMINASVLKQMKSTSMLINTARGPLVNQKDLAAALKSNEIAGAGIDVLDEEPPVDNPLLKEVPNLIITPHSAWSTYEARQRLIDEVSLNVEAFLKGNSRNIVN